MKKGYLKLLIVLPILILIYAFFLVLPQFNSKNNILISTVVMAIFIFFFFGYERERRQFQGRTIITVILFALIYFSLTYLLGLAVGFVANSYSLKPLTMLKNIIPVIFIIAASEISRYTIIKKGSRYSVIYWLAFVLFVIIDVLIDVNSQTFADRTGILTFIIQDVFPSLSRNFLFLYMSMEIGYRPVIVYRLIFELSIYMLPIFPNIDPYLKVVIEIIAPFILDLIVHSQMRFSNRGEIVGRKKYKKINIGIGILAWAFIIGIVMLSSGLFKYETLTIGSGSMTPNIDKGDIIIVKKTNMNEMQNIQEGQVLVSHQENKIIVHRIVSITDSNGGKLFVTKGDANQTADGWVTDENQIIGVVSFKIPLLGWPSVWLQEDILKNTSY